MKNRVRFSGYAALLASLVLILFCETEDTKESETISRLEKLTLEEINELRADEGIPSLLWNDTLADVAREHSADMGERDYFDHTTPEDVTFDERISDAGIEFSSAGENIFWTTADTLNYTIEELAQAAVDAWWNSPGHQAIMLTEEFNQAGVGCFQATEKLYFTLDVIKSP